MGSKILTIASVATTKTDSPSISVMIELITQTARSSEKGKYLLRSGRSHGFVGGSGMRRFRVLVAPTVVAVEREKVRRNRTRSVSVR
jgi:hypothetical protein